MAQKTTEQIKELVQKSRKILITSAKQFSGDGLAASLALWLIFKKLNKNADVVIESFQLPENLKFLPAVDEIKNDVKKLKKFIINLNITQTGIEGLNYDIQGNNLRIHLTPKQGGFTPEDLKFETGEFAYDLIFVVDTPELESLGRLYDYHRDLFYQIPVINIDHSPANEQYGHINLTDITAASTTEIIYQLLKEWDPILINEEVATCLLTGLIAKTRSFKTNQVTPEALRAASELINLGANRKQIVTQLYQTKNINTLKLWGKILGRLQIDESAKLVWSKLDLHDFTECGAAAKDIGGIIDELITTSPLAEIIILFYQINLEQTKVLIYSQGPQNALKLAREFSPLGDKTNASFIINEGLPQTEQKVIAAISAQIGN
ncbi:MAG: DHH family phosphoesterase [Candidatus Komeilibacteria bacterium]|nr:DHH family phosphoesterase [Candidatus Komeilibacteria bacterium]